MKRFLKRIGFFVLVILLFNIVFVWFYEIPKREAIANGSHDKLIKWQAIHDPNNSFNVIILGSSRGYSAYNPLVIDSIANTNSYNMCTGSQNIVETYYILKEIIKYQKPEIIVYDLFLPSLRDKPDYYHVLENAEFMSSNSKTDLILNGFGLKTLFYYLIPIFKYKYYIKEDIYNIALFKNNNSRSDATYWVNGYNYREDMVDSKTIQNFPPIYSFDNTDVSVSNLEKNLTALIRLCRKNDIELICVRAPYPPSRLQKSPPDEVADYFKNICANFDVPFYDFNYTNKDVFNDSDFADYHHMNYFGANKVSRQLGEILKKEQTE